MTDKINELCAQMLDLIDMVVAISNCLKELSVKLGDNWEQAGKICGSNLWQWAPGYNTIICMNLMSNAATVLSHNRVFLI